MEKTGARTLSPETQYELRKQLVRLRKNGMNNHQVSVETDKRYKVFLILDNHRVHHSKLVKKWLAKHDEQIELFFLPSYSPELNPDEYPKMAS